MITNMRQFISREGCRWGMVRRFRPYTGLLYGGRPDEQIYRTSQKNIQDVPNKRRNDKVSVGCLQEDVHGIYTSTIDGIKGNFTGGVL